MPWTIFLRTILLTLCLLLLQSTSYSYGEEERIARFSLNPFAREEEEASTFPIPIPIPSILKPDVPDHCKDPLKKVISYMVEYSVSSFLPFIEPSYTPEFTQDFKSRKAGDMTEHIIEVGLTEGNMARVTSRVAAFDLRLIPFFGDRLASVVERRIEAATRKALDSLCSTMNCCFD